MGVNLKNIILAKEVEMSNLAGKKIAIDAFNTLYAFLSIIRDRMTGEPLRDSKGRTTSHLSGLFYRTSNLLEAGIKPVFVFDGKPPEFKRKTVEERQRLREEAKKKWEEAVKKGEKAITYAQAASQLNDEMIEESKKLLNYMGIPWVQAKSEGEFQCAHMCKVGDVWSSGSQDYDSLLVGSPRLVRNLSVTGRRKVPRKEAYIEIKPEMIELDQLLTGLGITQEQLIVLGILVGTDYGPGPKGIGPKTALKLVKECKTLDEVLTKVKWEADVGAEEIFSFFLNPPVEEKYKMEWKAPDPEKIIEFMVNEHDFSRERVDKIIERIQKPFTAGRQASLKGWLSK